MSNNERLASSITEAMNKGVTVYEICAVLDILGKVSDLALDTGYVCRNTKSPGPFIRGQNWEKKS